METTIEKPKRYTPQAFAAEMGISLRSVHRLIKTRQVQSYKLGGKRFILPLDEKLEASRRASV